VNPERWEKIKDLFGSTVELDPSQRSAFLRDACGSDEALRAEVESLLASYQRTEDLDEQYPSPAADPLPFGEKLIGRRLGAYQVLHQMGQGGMAAVYAAVRADDEYRKRVAIKVVLPHLASEDMVRRFRNERQTLATLDHPNIVRLLDGGTTDAGLPYLVMEYVDGVRIDEYCNSRRLSSVDRLKLFRIVCGAVQYAHQNLVVHRDLKPSNIFVTADGTPKVLDFGIAKLLNPESAAQTVLTQPDMRPMTLDYASPEQFRGHPVTTSSDVYSLGVVLYELLTGQHPYDLQERSPLEIDRIISDVEPDKPSTAVNQTDPTTGGVTDAVASGWGASVSRHLRGDLDNIVLMALRKEPQRRYASVEQLSEDIRRHLEGLPVIARAPTLRYRTSKFVRRHTLGVAAAATVAAALLLGIVVTTHEARVAERRFQDVRQLADALLFKLEPAVKDLPGATPARQLIVQEALTYLDGLARDASGNAELQGDLAEGYLRVGEVQHGGYHANLGDADGALASDRKAGGIAAALVRRQPTNLTAKRYVARSEQGIGVVLLMTGHAAQAVDSLRRAVSGFEELTTAEPRDTESAFHLADCYNALGDGLASASIANNLGDPKGALEDYQKALAVYEHLSGAYPSSRNFQSGVAVGNAKIGDMHAAAGDSTAALESYGTARAAYEALTRTEPNNAQYRGNFGAIIQRIALLRLNAGNKAGGLADFHQLVEMDREHAAADPSDVKAHQGLWLAYFDLGKALEGIDRRSAASNYRLALGVIESLAAAQPSNLEVRARLAASLVRLGDLLATSGDRAAGHSFMARGVGVQKSLADRPDASLGQLDDYVTIVASCKPGHPCDAAAALPYARRIVEKSREQDPESLETLALTYLQAGDPADAVATEQKAVALVAPAARAPYQANLAKFQQALRHRSPH
jgi:serine/threonine protein kinase/tetratricopeptide (TPR) repeat protein